MNNKIHLKKNSDRLTTIIVETTGIKIRKKSERL